MNDAQQPVEGNLLPCPWCGHDAFVAVHEIPNTNHGGTWWQVGCKGCGVSFPLAFQRDGAVREWNDRHALANPPAGEQRGEACKTDVCVFASADGVTCCDESCDKEDGTRSWESVARGLKARAVAAEERESALRAEIEGVNERLAMVRKLASEDAMKLQSELRRVEEERDHNAERRDHYMELVNHMGLKMAKAEAERDGLSKAICGDPASTEDAIACLKSMRMEERGWSEHLQRQVETVKKALGECPACAGNGSKSVHVEGNQWDTEECATCQGTGAALAAGQGGAPTQEAPPLPSNQDRARLHFLLDFMGKNRAALVISFYPINPETGRESLLPVTVTGPWVRLLRPLMEAAVAQPASTTEGKPQ